MDIKLTIHAPELAAAIQTLAGALQSTIGENRGENGGTSITPTAPTQTPVQAVPTQAQTPVQASAPTQIPTQAPVQTPVQTPVPTTAPTYTMEQLAVAATQLVDAGRRTELVGLLGQFNVQALTELPKEQYGAFATKLREMGAKI